MDNIGITIILCFSFMFFMVQCWRIESKINELENMIQEMKKSILNKLDKE